ncbi:hypothetical protein EPD62_003230 [Acetivibrio thermocellus]|uniref:hypothetical protein n=1 Tax=Acetivibrio thermocellus TaxID=1515 RepID=UPI001F1966D7|nr:hypothetical protein [Acetivibrio thermocellus]
MLSEEEIYCKFINESISLKIPQKLLLSLVRQMNRHLEILNLEKELYDNVAIQEDINNTEVIRTKLFLCISAANDRKDDIHMELSIAEFLTLWDCVYCNNSLLHLQAKMKPQIIKVYKKFYEYIESIYEMLDSDEVKTYWNFIINYKTKDSMLQ